MGENKYPLALLSLPSAEHEVVGLACHGNSVLQSPLISLCLLALSLTNLAYHGLPASISFSGLVWVGFHAIFLVFKDVT